MVFASWLSTADMGAAAHYVDAVVDSSADGEPQFVLNQLSSHTQIAGSFSMSCWRW